MEKVISLSRILILLLTLSALISCATDSDRRPASFGDVELDENSNAHPAAYLVDRFPVNRPFPKHKAPNTEPFYFKRCSEVGGEFPYSRTSYDCHYP
jgi:hypothetical protein